MLCVYVLSEYEYDTYSFSGMCVQNTHIHLTKEGAERHAAELGLEIVEYCKDPSKHATIYTQGLLP